MLAPLNLNMKLKRSDISVGKIVLNTLAKTSTFNIHTK
jgi:hypothetical protein